MALIECKECGNEVSDKAESCPNCGAPNKKKPSGCCAGIGCGPLVVAFLILGLFGSYNSAKKRRLNQGKVAAKKETVVKAKKQENGKAKASSKKAIVSQKAKPSAKKVDAQEALKKFHEMISEIEGSEKLVSSISYKNGFTIIKVQNAFIYQPEKIQLQLAQSFHKGLRVAFNEGNPLMKVVDQNDNILARSGIFGGVSLEK